MRSNTKFYVWENDAMMNRIFKVLSLMANGMIEANKYISNGGGGRLEVTL